jgi:hypothetical protein
MESLFLRVFIITFATTLGVLSAVASMIGIFVFWQGGKKSEVKEG